MPKIGLTLSSVTDEEVVEGSSRPKTKPGIILGLAVYSKSNKAFHIYPEFLFIQKGFRIDEGGNSFGYKVKEQFSFTINYLAVPVLAKQYLNPKTRNLYILGGFCAGVAVGGRYSYDYHENNNGAITELTKGGKLDFSEEILGYNGEDYSIYKKGDFGIQIGMGFSMFKKVNMDLRYEIGFSQLSKQDVSKPKNRVLQWTIGLPIPVTFN